MKEQLYQAAFRLQHSRRFQNAAAVQSLEQEIVVFYLAVPYYPLHFSHAGLIEKVDF